MSHKSSPTRVRAYLPSSQAIASDQARASRAIVIRGHVKTLKEAPVFSADWVKSVSALHFISRSIAVQGPLHHLPHHGIKSHIFPLSNDSLSSCFEKKDQFSRSATDSHHTSSSFKATTSSAVVAKGATTHLPQNMVRDVREALSMSSAIAPLDPQSLGRVSDQETLWDQGRDELSLRILVEEGKVNTVLRLLRGFRAASRKPEFQKTIEHMITSKIRSREAIFALCTRLEISSLIILRSLLEFAEVVQLMDISQLINFASETLQDATRLLQGTPTFYQSALFGGGAGISWITDWESLQDPSFGSGTGAGAGAGGTSKSRSAKKQSGQDNDDDTDDDNSVECDTDGSSGLEDLSEHRICRPSTPGAGEYLHHRSSTSSSSSSSALSSTDTQTAGALKHCTHNQRQQQRSGNDTDSDDEFGIPNANTNTNSSSSSSSSSHGKHCSQCTTSKMSSSSNVSGSRHSNTNDPKGLDEKLRRASLASGILSTPNQRNSITASSSSSSSSSSPSSSTLATAAAATMTVQASPSPQSLDHVLSPDRVDTPPQQSTIIRFRDDPHHQHHQHQRVSITSTAPLSSPISPSSSSTSTSSPSPSSSSNQIPAHPLLLPSSAAYSECLVMRILGRLCDHLPRLAVMSATTTSASNAVLAEFAAKGLCEKIVAHLCSYYNEYRIAPVHAAVMFLSAVASSDMCDASPSTFYPTSLSEEGLIFIAREVCQHLVAPFHIENAPRFVPSVAVTTDHTPVSAHKFGRRSIVAAAAGAGAATPRLSEVTLGREIGLEGGAYESNATSSSLPSSSSSSATTTSATTISPTHVVSADDFPPLPSSSSSSSSSSTSSSASPHGSTSGRVDTATDHSGDVGNNNNDNADADDDDDDDEFSFSPRVPAKGVPPTTLTHHLPSPNPSQTPAKSSDVGGLANADPTVSDKPVSSSFSISSFSSSLSSSLAVSYAPLPGAAALVRLADKILLLRRRRALEDEMLGASGNTCILGSPGGALSPPQSNQTASNGITSPGLSTPVRSPPGTSTNSPLSVPKAGAATPSPSPLKALQLARARGAAFFSNSKGGT